MHTLSYIRNKSLGTGTVPTSMKIANIIPIYKAKAKNLFSNYRPISLLPNISIILEQMYINTFIICWNIIKFSTQISLVSEPTTLPLMQ